jgi:hypothetical protein
VKHSAGLSDMIPGRSVRGGAALGTRLWHIVISPKGSIPQDPARGWGLPAKLGKKASETSLKMEAAVGRDELKKDPEVRDATVTITEESAGFYRVRIAAMPTEGAAIEFDEVIEGLS